MERNPKVNNNRELVTTNQEPAHAPVEHQKKPPGCLKRALLHIWATKDTLDITKDNKDLKIKTTFRELIIYCLFLLVITVVTLGMTNTLASAYTSTLNLLFIQTPADPTNPGSNFLGMNLHSDFFDFLEKSLIVNLYTTWETVYNGDTTPGEGHGMIYYENKLQGVPRIRQVRVKSNSCFIPSDFKSQIKACYAAYSQNSADMSPFGRKNGTAWTYSSQEKLKSESVTGKVNSYDGGGFYQDLNTTGNASLALILDLKKNLWVDRATRAVFIDFTVYNANLNLFCGIKLIAEFPPTGGIVPSYVFRPSKLIRYNSIGDYVVMGFEFAFCVFIAYYIIEEMIEIRNLGFSYLKEFWNILDIINLIIGVCCIVFNVFCHFKIKNHMETAFLSPDAYIDFDFLTYWQMIFNSAQAIMVFSSWIKLFKYISFSKSMSQLSMTLGASSKDLSGFSVMFMIIFLAFAQLGYLMFGTQAVDFSTFSESIFTLFRIILGDFDFQALQLANRVLGPLYFILYVFIVFFILLNMFLAIIGDTYSEVKADLASKPSEIDVGGFFTERANTLLVKLNLKRKKLIDLESAISNADANDDKMIDFDEWRVELKKRGYADDEIESVFLKYDKSGDRKLDENELRRFQEDLNNEKLILTKSINKERNGKEDNEDGYQTGDDDIDSTGVEFVNLQKRVSRLESSIGGIVSKINSVLVKLEVMENAKMKRRENIGKVIEDISESNDLTDDMAEHEVEKVVGEEMKRWESESFSKNIIN